jgi:hypothetical protein
MVYGLKSMQRGSIFSSFLVIDIPGLMRLLFGYDGDKMETHGKDQHLLKSGREKDYRWQ